MNTAYRPYTNSGPWHGGFKGFGQTHFWTIILGRPMIFEGMKGAIGH